MSIDLGSLPGGFSLALAADFSIESEEIAKGQAAVQNYLDSLKSGDERSSATEALETLTLVLSTGACEGLDFPWHQVRAHHNQAAINILKEDGAPSRLESLRCSLDPNHKFRQDGERFSTKKIQKIRTSLKRVLKESHQLGFMSKDDWDRLKSPNVPVITDKDRIVTHGEFRALLAVCRTPNDQQSYRDYLVIFLMYHGGLMLAELQAVTLDDLKFDRKTQQLKVKTGKAKNQKSRRLALPNEALIALEDWLEIRGSEPGPLLVPVKKKGPVEIKRLSGEEIRGCCDLRLKEAGVAPFTPDELRKSTAAQIQLERAAEKARKARVRALKLAEPQKEESEPLIVLDDAIDDSSEGWAGAEEPIAKNFNNAGMAKICFPVWERSLNS